MTIEPISFLKDTFPALFNKGFSLIQAKAAAGDERFKASLEDISAADGSAVFAVEGEGRVFLTNVGGKMTSGDAPGGPIKVAVEFPADAAEVVLGHAAAHLDDERTAIAAAHTASKQLETTLQGKQLTCHLVVKDAPDLGDVTVKVGFNVDEPPQTPGFTAQIKYDDLEAVRDGKANVQQLFMQGKLRMTGDYSFALQVAMQLAAKAQQRQQQKK